jgi:hypothetical protein
VLAAAPTWFSENLLLIAGVTLAVVTLLIVRMVQKAMVRVVLLGAVVLVAGLVYVNREPLETCARTCQCSLGGEVVTVPFCRRDLDL